MKVQYHFQPKNKDLVGERATGVTEPLNLRLQMDAPINSKI